MLNEVARTLAGAAAVPAGAVAGALHRMATGQRAVLELKVKLWEDLSVRHRVLHTLRRAADDEAVVALLVRIESAPGSWAACQDLRAALEYAREQGTDVYALLEQPGNAATWIAAAADRVFLVPTTEVGLVGLGVELTFLGAALRKLGIEPDFEAAGAYKSFGEPYTRTHASPENQEAVRVLIDDLHEQLVDGLAQGRDLSPDAVRGLLAEAPLSAEQALEAGLVDELAYEDEVHDWIEEQHGEPTKRVAFGSWARRDVALQWIEGWGHANHQIAIVHLQGPIVMDDKTPTPMIRARKVVPLLRLLRESDAVEAVVLHVNSPGGSALASDLIWREVDLLCEAKPVVASFEDVAASGGYYLSAPAVEILARPGTLTGSIGVFGGKLVMGETLRKAGVHTQAVTAAPNANVFSATQHFTDDQRERFRSSLQRFYEGFVQRVAEGRDQPESEIEPHCRGRVWTGSLARERHLVDREGGIDDAVERARELSGLRPGTYREVAVTPSLSRSLLARLMAAAMREALPRLGDGAVARLVDLADQVVGPDLARMLQVATRHAGQPLAMLPFDLRLR